ncbi:molybdate ABC transporter substrate-binding protein [Paralimibaculum aggregatum]|uniref:Molybdate ABC transporter substrate-binding protein n=1 Tax=Paralimibaculum aggregatum TaxID=3036245 RepID=A0ABQ6LIN3_9RHOB|nr:molybdate ABC transporter substrate-binding protein [Limibaculum sp. NKW23]GMG83133.1 molybdate ABC transporter substrate-binding protein [Limibaculum sp. NKW23]
MRSRAIAGAVAAGAMLMSLGAAAEPVTLFAAGSLKTALGAVAEAFAERHGTAVETRFGPSGLMRGRIEAGETAHVFASANMRHPRRLEAAGRGGPVALFARNRLCALTQPEATAESDTLLAAMLDDGTRLGTSTPKADPSGDYAWALFDRAEALVPGAAEALKAKALQLTGGPDSASAPEGRNTYGWVMENDRADIFLTYCTNAVLARAEVPELRIVAIPAALSVGADYGLMVLDGAPEEAWKLAVYILSPAGQRVLAEYGFESGALPAGE